MGNLREAFLYASLWTRAGPHDFMNEIFSLVLMYRIITLLGEREKEIGDFYKFLQFWVVRSRSFPESMRVCLGLILQLSMGHDPLYLTGSPSSPPQNLEQIFLFPGLMACRLLYLTTTCLCSCGMQTQSHFFWVYLEGFPFPQLDSMCVIALGYITSQDMKKCPKHIEPNISRRAQLHGSGGEQECPRIFRAVAWLQALQQSQWTSKGGSRDLWYQYIMRARRKAVKPSTSSCLSSKGWLLRTCKSP